MTLRSTPSLLLIAAAFGAEQQFDTSRWSHRAALAVPANKGQATYARFKLDSEAYRHTSPLLSDLRIVSPSGVEVPYTFRPSRSGGTARIDLHPRMINRVTTARGELQFVLDFGVGSRMSHNSLRFKWSESGFRRRIRIESSSNRAQWDLVREAELLDFRQDGLVYQTLLIDYPDSTERYLRLTLSDWPEPGTLISVDSSHEAAAPRDFTELAVPTLRTSAAQRGEAAGDAAFEFDLPFRMPSPVRLDFEIEGGNFVRAVEVQARYQARPWSGFCYGTIARVEGDSSTFIECTATLEGRVRVLVRNRDNAPLGFKAVRALAPVSYVVFATPEAGTYFAYAGNPKARPSEYDLDEVLSRTSNTVPAEATVSTWHHNPRYQPPPEPLSERARAWLTPLLSVLALAIGLAAFLLIRRTRV